MRILKRFSSALILVLIFGFLSISKIYANTNIYLEDYIDESKITVSLDSEEEYIAGVDMTIVFSDEVIVTDVEISEGFCIMASDHLITDNEVNIECFNELDTTMSGAFATVHYITEAEDYFFYIDRGSLDIGGTALGEIQDINKPEGLDTTEDFTEEEVVIETTTEEGNFFIDNLVYILSGILIIGIIILIVVIIKL